VYNLVRKFNPSLDLLTELKKDDEFKDILSLEDARDDKIEQEIEEEVNENTNLEFKDPLDNYNIVIEDCSQYPMNLKQFDSAAFDEHYIYLSSEDYGLVKIGAVNKDNVEKGKLYVHQPKWKGYKFNIL
jgi:hypothetical protein